MLIGIVIALAGLVAVGASYYNRDNLAGPPRGRELAFYVGAVVLAAAVGVAAAVIISHGTGACGRPGDGSHCS